MRKSISAHFVPLFDSPKVSHTQSGFFVFTVTALVLLTSLLLPARSFAQTQLISGIAFQDPTDESLDTATSYLVLNFNDGPGGANNPSSNYLLQYNWDPSTTQSGWNLVNSFFTTVSSPSNISGTVDATYYSEFGEHFIDGFSLNGSTQDDNNPDPNSAYWNYFLAGSSDGTYPTNDDTLTSALNGVWTSSAIGSDNFVLTQGSVDGYEWGGLDSNYNPLNEPVVPTTPAPEASSVFFELASLVVLICLYIGKSKAEKSKKMRSV